MDKVIATICTLNQDVLHIYADRVVTTTSGLLEFYDSDDKQTAIVPIANIASVVFGSEAKV